MQILLTGSTGAIGSELARALVDAGDTVLAATRDPAGYDGPGDAVGLDLDTDRWPESADGADAAYYLVHALDRPDHAEIDRRRAERFVERWGPDRPVVYLGGLGADGASSEHLAARHEVGEILRAGCPTVELRASIVIGPESISFRLLRGLSRFAGCTLLPTFVPVPTAATALTQPIAQSDLTRVLVEALDVPPGCYDVGGPDVLSFADLVEVGAAAQGRRLQVLPLLPLGAQWIAPPASVVAATDVWSTVALFGSMGVETVVRPGHEPPGVTPPTTGVAEAIRAANQAIDDAA